MTLNKVYIAAGTVENHWAMFACSSTGHFSAWCPTNRTSATPSTKSTITISAPTHTTDRTAFRNPDMISCRSRENFISRTSRNTRAIRNPRARVTVVPITEWPRRSWSRSDITAGITHKSNALVATRMRSNTFHPARKNCVSPVCQNRSKSSAVKKARNKCSLAARPGRSGLSVDTPISILFARIITPERMERAVPSTWQSGPSSLWWTTWLPSSTS
mmetsp:Transcript_94415/g.252597  ORF Transcript_94415/g.252597 Transcript_94415/m.252597 type:complete len:217 (+) Transcript_94415:716-1366(+)